MLRTIGRALVYAAAIVGVVLTLSLGLGAPDLDRATMPLFSIGAILVLYALIPRSWTRMPSRLEGPAAVEDAAYLLRQRDHDVPRTVRLSQRMAEHRISIQWALTGVVVLLTAWLLLACAPSLLVP